jgi:hypothetical protein
LERVQERAEREGSVGVEVEGKWGNYLRTLWVELRVEGVLVDEKKTKTTAVEPRAASEGRKGEV